MQQEKHSKFGKRSHCKQSGEFLGLSDKMVEWQEIESKLLEKVGGCDWCRGAGRQQSNQLFQPTFGRPWFERIRDSIDALCEKKRGHQRQRPGTEEVGASQTNMTAGQSAEAARGPSARQGKEAPAQVGKNCSW
jgi:hypothetical protein